VKSTEMEKKRNEMVEKVGGEDYTGDILARLKISEWRPSQKQIEAVSIIVNPDERMTVTELCKRVGITRPTWYNWLMDKRFKSYFHAVLNLENESGLLDAWRCLRDSMKKGSVTAAVRYLEVMKMFTPAVNHVISGDTVSPVEVNVVPKFNMPPPPAKRIEAKFDDEEEEDEDL